ncbi:MAG: helix-turn-helix domain-containing protein [Pseudomonadota bacterium]
MRIPLAVQLTGLSRSRIYELIDTGELETIKIGGSRLIPYDALKQFIQNHRQAGASN